MGGICSAVQLARRPRKQSRQPGSSPWRQSWEAAAGSTSQAAAPAVPYRYTMRCGHARLGVACSVHGLAHNAQRAGCMQGRRTSWETKNGAHSARSGTHNRRDRPLTGSSNTQFCTPGRQPKPACRTLLLVFLRNRDICLPQRPCPHAPAGLQHSMPTAWHRRARDSG